MEHIDVILYRQNFLNALSNDGILEDYKNELGIDNLNKFSSLIEEELEFVCAENVIEKGYPTLDEEQFSEMMGRCIASYYLDELVNKGLLQKDYDVEVNDNVFRLTEKGLEEAERKFGANGID